MKPNFEKNYQLGQLPHGKKEIKAEESYDKIRDFLKIIMKLSQEVMADVMVMHLLVKQYFLQKDSINLSVW